MKNCTIRSKQDKSTVACDTSNMRHDGKSVELPLNAVSLSVASVASAISFQYENGPKGWDDQSSTAAAYNVQALKTKAQLGAFVFLVETNVQNLRDWKIVSCLHATVSWASVPEASNKVAQSWPTHSAHKTCLFVATHSARNIIREKNLTKLYGNNCSNAYMLKLKIFSNTRSYCLREGSLHVHVSQANLGCKNWQIVNPNSPTQGNSQSSPRKDV